MHCRICGGKPGKGRLCKNCDYLLKNGADEETIKRMLSDDRARKVWKENEKISEALADAYYDSVIENYKNIKEDSKENFGYNTFADGIRVGLDIILPMLDEDMQMEVKDKIESMIRAREGK